MADIPLKSDDEMTNDLVGAVENIAQSVKAGSRDFTKSFNGLTAAIKRLQTNLVNAIKSIKVQVVAKPEKVQKPAVKDKATSTKEVVKEKETKTEVKPDLKAKAKKAEAKKEPVVAPVEVKVEPQSNAPLKEENKEQSSSEKNAENKKLADAEALILKALAGDFKTFWKKLREFSIKVNDNDVVSKALKSLTDQGKIKKDPDKSAVYSLAEKTKQEKPKETKKATEPKKQEAPKVPKAPKVEKPVDPEVEAEKQRKKKRLEESAELRLQTQRNALQLSALRLQNALNPPPKALPKEKPKPVDPQEKERIVKEKAREKEIEKRQERVKPVKISSLIEGINQTGDAWSKMISGVRKSIIESDKARKAEEQKVAKTGKEGTKDFVGPPKNLFDKNERKISDAAEQEAADEAKRRDDIDRETANAEKTLRTYFRKQEERQASQEEKAANDLIKQQEQAARELAQANQKTKRELDSLVAGFQGLSSLFKGPLVRFGLNMVAKGIGFKQPKTMSKGGDVSYLADGGTAMKPKGTDTQPAMLTPGEFVVKKDAAKDPENRKQLESINSGKNKKKTEYRASGGSVGGVGYYAAGGSVGSIIASAVVNIGSTVSTIVNAAKSITVVGAASTALGIAFNSITQSVKIANQALAVFGPMVAKANPALMQKLEIVMNDLSGVIGRALIPAVEYLSPLLRKYADYVDYSMKKLTPSINKSAVAFDNIVSPLMDLGAVVYSVIGPVFNALATIVVGVSNVLKPIIEFITAFSSALVQTIGVLASPIVSVAMATLSVAFYALTLVIKTTLEIIQTLLGAFVNIVGLIIQGLGKVISYIPLMGDVGESIAKSGEAISKSGESLKQGKPAEQDRIKKGSSVGAAVREVSSTSIAGVGDEVRKNAMMAASGQKTQEDMLGDISNKLDKNSLADAFAEGMKKAKENKPQTTPPVQIQGKIPGALNKQEQVELGTV